MIWEHYRQQPGGDRDFIELLTLTKQHGQDAIEMACELAVEYGPADQRSAYLNCSATRCGATLGDYSTTA